jgi:two-component system, OmpR family, response regulator MtrA
LVIDPGRQQVTWRGVALRLTRLKRDVLGCLAEPPLRVWSYERMYSAVWRTAYVGDTSTLHAAAKRLRRKLREAGVAAAVESVRSIGFRLSVEPTQARVSPVAPVA